MKNETNLYRDDILISSRKHFFFRKNYIKNTRTDIVNRTKNGKKIVKITTNDMERIDKASLLEVIAESSVKFEDKFFHIKKNIQIKTILVLR